MTTTVQRAAQLQERGLRVFPVDHPVHPHCIGSTCSKLRGEGKDPDCNRDNRKRRGKHPIGGWTTIAATPHSEKGLLYYFADRETGPVNIGIACKASGILVIDEDVFEAFIRFAESREQTIGCNYRVQTGKGVHYYYGPPECGTPIGNRSGTLVEWGIDVRGGVASANNGGYVLAPGSTHASGAVYTELDEWPGKDNLRPFPAWLVPEVRAAVSTAKTTPLGMDGAGQPSQGKTGAAGQRSGTVFGGQGGEGWTDDTRFGSRAELVAQFERHVLEAKALAGMPSPGAEWRHRFFLAGLDGWRLIAIGANRAEVEARLLAAIQHVWQAGPDSGDEAIVAEAKAKAAASPWELYEQAPQIEPSEPDGAATPPSHSSHPTDGVEPAQATSTTSSDEEVRAVFPGENQETLTQSDLPSSGGAPDSASDDALTSDAEGMPWEGGEGFTLGDAPVDMAELAEREVVRLAGEHELTVAKRYALKKADRVAQQRLDAEARDPLRRMSLSQFMASPPPDYLVPQMLYRDGITVLFGAEGSAKSFLILDIGLSLSTGTAWHGHDIGKGRAYYVMGEGQSTNMLRTHAWFKYHPEANLDTAEDMFVVFPVPVLLTEAGIAELLEHVKRDQPDLIVFDTKNLMFAGKESAGEDAGAMLRVLHLLRLAAGGCCVVLVDHTGLFDETRTRGGNGQRAGTETEIRVAEKDGKRWVFCTRDKSAPYDSNKPLWAFTLRQVDEVPRPRDVAAPAVCVPATLEELDSWSTVFGGGSTSWTDANQPELPVEVVRYIGPGSAAVPSLARFMRHQGSGGTGFSRAEAVSAVRKVLGQLPKPPSDDTIQRAWGGLVELGRLVVLEGNSANGRSEWVAKPGDPT